MPLTPKQEAAAATLQAVDSHIERAVSAADEAIASLDNALLCVRSSSDILAVVIRQRQAEAHLLRSNSTQLLAAIRKDLQRAERA